MSLCNATRACGVWNDPLLDHGVRRRTQRLPSLALMMGDRGGRKFKTIKADRGQAVDDVGTEMMKTSGSLFPFSLSQVVCRGLMALWVW
jgi:hypothetical protein